MNLKRIIALIALGLAACSSPSQQRAQLKERCREFVTAHNEGLRDYDKVVERYLGPVLDDHSNYDGSLKFVDPEEERAAELKKVEDQKTEAECRKAGYIRPNP